MTGDDFCQLAERLRALGACKVKAGDLEVVFTPVPAAVAKPVEASPPVQKRPKRKPLSAEEARLALYREELGEDMPRDN